MFKKYLQMPPIVLASASNKRADILKELGINFTVAASNAIETKWKDAIKNAAVSNNQQDAKKNKLLEKIAKKMVLQNAKLKCDTIANTQENSLIIAADTIVFCHGIVFEKPKTIKEGRRMFTSYIAHPTKVLTALYLRFPNNKVGSGAVESTHMLNRKYSKEEYNRFFEIIFDQEKSGGFTIEGLGALLFDNIRGSFYNVLGLPVHMLYTLAQKNGYRLW